MSKSLDIPWSRVKAIIEKKKKEYGAEKPGPYSIHSDRARRTLMREATKTPLEGVTSFRG